MLPNLGIIAGRGSLPYLIAGNYTKQGGNCCIAAIKDEADIDQIKNFSLDQKIENIIQGFS